MKKKDPDLEPFCCLILKVFDQIMANLDDLEEINLAGFFINSVKPGHGFIIYPVGLELDLYFHNVVIENPVNLAIVRINSGFDPQEEFLKNC